MARGKQTEPTRYAVKNDSGMYFSNVGGWGTLNLATLFTTRASASQTAGILREGGNGVKVVPIILKDSTDEPAQTQPPAAA